MHAKKIAFFRLVGSVTATMVLFGLGTTLAHAGPPFVTDDPEPTGYRHWEIYSGFTYTRDDSGSVDASFPFAEFNYGALPNVQMSISLPMTFTEATPADRPHYRTGGVDFGIKVRFVEESQTRPQISFYPSIETPSPGSGNRTVTSLPIWLQKSWGRWTAFGGAGLYLNPGLRHRNYSFAGGALERALSPGTTVGAELFRESAASLRDRGTAGTNVGAIMQVGTYHAVLFSIGRGLSNGDRLSSYASYEFELGPSDRGGASFER
ncbi:MAG: hypothetical protein IAI48_12625 [Candidatus Eremiobacteraeota bacterium]|nr:hypothetical protein [Candidatus Eremiobacteraeota bacterium]